MKLFNNLKLTKMFSFKTIFWVFFPMASSHFKNKKSTTEMDQPLKVRCHRGCGWKQAAGDREAVGAQGQCWQCMSREGRGVGQRKYTVGKYQVWTQESKTEVFCAGTSLAQQAGEPDRELQRQEKR